MAPDDRDRPTGVDHLLFGAPVLEHGLDVIERVLGTRPERGGHHPRYGTHNALLSLGPTTYLEVIAPDPELTPPPRGIPFGLAELVSPRLVTWVLRSEQIEHRVVSARKAGTILGPIETGTRQRPDGTDLSWKATDPYAVSLDGAVPFVISWGDTPHPAASASAAGTLVDLRIEHDRPDGVREALAGLSVDLEVRKAEAFALVATSRTPRGVVELR